MVFSSFFIYSSVIFSPHPPTHVIWTISPDRENRAGWLYDIRLAGNRRDSPSWPQTHTGLAEVGHFRVNYGTLLYDISAFGQCSSFKVQISLRCVTLITCRRRAKLLKENHISMPINWTAVYLIEFNYFLLLVSVILSSVLPPEAAEFFLARPWPLLSLSLFSFPSWSRRRPKWHLWTAGSSWWRRSWTALRRDWLLLCRNWRRPRRMRMRVKGENQLGN